MENMEVPPGEHISDACWKLYQEVYEDDKPHMMDFNGLIVIMVPTKDWSLKPDQKIQSSEESAEMET